MKDKDDYFRLPMFAFDKEEGVMFTWSGVCTNRQHMQSYMQTRINIWRHSDASNMSVPARSSAMAGHIIQKL